MDKKQASRFATGVVLIVLGLVFLAEHLHMIPELDLRRLWPLVLITLGVGRFAAKTEDGSHRGGLWLMCVGGLFLLNNYEIFTLDRSWPLFIVAGGVSILLGRRHDTRPGGARS